MPSRKNRRLAPTRQPRGGNRFWRLNAKLQNSPKPRKRHRVSTVQELEEACDYSPSKSALIVVGRFCLGLVLLVPCLAVTLLIVDQIKQGVLIEVVRSITSSSYFLLGAVLCVVGHLIPFVRTLLTPFYIFGHEVTHAIFVFMCYGDVSEFEAKADGGYIIANRANILVSLSPYIFPFWVLGVALLYFLSGIFIDITPYHSYFSLLFGATWSFNLVWTMIMLPLGQSDLIDNGTFLSLTVIYLSNALTLSFLLSSIQSNSSSFDWFFSVLNKNLDLLNLFI